MGSTLIVTYLNDLFDVLDVNLGEGRIISFADDTAVQG